MSSKDVLVDEDLPNFFTALKLTQADELLEESENLKRNYEIEVEDQRLL